MQLSKRTLALILFLALLLALVMYVVAGRPPQAGPTPPPHLSPRIIAELKASHGFQYLVSYTAHGFEPRDSKVKAGSIIRFMNNSGKVLRVVTASTTSAVIGPCAKNSFDSCELAPYEFWEYTAPASSTINFENAENPYHTGVMHIQ